MRNTKRTALGAAALVLAVSLALTVLFGKPVRAEDFETKLEAAQLMQTWMDRVKAYKAEAGLAPVPEDLHGTGMIGEPYTGITTTNGALEAKRTTANPDMAALVVQLLEEAGIGPGDRVGAGFSGSFPAMDLAVLAACQAMDVEVVYIASVGASTYGANQPEVTLPDMLDRLTREGLLDHGPAAVSLGGQRDCGLDMDPDLREEIAARLTGLGYMLIREEDYGVNLARREELYGAEGPISCFIGVGGNMTTSGIGENELSQRWGVIPPDRVKSVDENSGLLQRFNAKGLPVIHLLNIKKLVADYGLPYDPERLMPPGESAVYYMVRYPWPIAAAGVGLAMAALIWGRWKVKKEGSHEE